MNKSIAIILTLAAAAALSGCGNALNGAKQDTADNTAAAHQAADQAGQAADQAGQAAKASAQRAGQALAVGPEFAAANAVRVPVKAAILRDPVLTDTRNLIDVNAAPKKITLTGHVADASMKQRATEDANVALKKHPGYTLSNELTVAGQ
ncbi:MAG: hypothetical protein ACRYFS_18230 [Janthinobacterium lividum]